MESTFYVPYSPLSLYRQLGSEAVAPLIFEQALSTVLKYYDSKGNIYYSKVREKSTLENLLEPTNDPLLNHVLETPLPQVGPLQILRRLPSDNTVVYKGLYQNREVVVKMYTAQEANSDELHILSLLTSTNSFPRPIMRLYLDPPLRIQEDITRVEVLEYIQGFPLDDVFVVDIRPVIRGVLSQIEQLQNAKIVHSDVHSKNIIITPDSKVRLIDFGLSFNIPSGRKKSVESSDRDFLYLLGLLDNYVKIGALSVYEYLEHLGYSQDVITAEHIRTLLEDPNLEMIF